MNDKELLREQFIFLSTMAIQWSDLEGGLCTEDLKKCRDAILSLIDDQPGPDIIDELIERLEKDRDGTVKEAT